ncbi:YciI family protein [Ascidiimonas sp. W6]|uniref:YciI family protein n=1 Tax=Ascidiimonas meishanensis TaxID=3128903 RepID=UPI0030EC01EB
MENSILKMKKYILIMLASLGLISCNTELSDEKTAEKKEILPKNSSDTDSLTIDHETFSYKEGDTTYVMQKYFMVFLKKGAIRNQDSIARIKLQTAHQAHLEKLHLMGKICIAGPFDDESTVSGVVIYNTPTFKEADSLAKSDPAVKAGMLTVETHPWWAAKGSVLK